jgi:glycosyltransferase involved in cell wall biosynthesis
VRDFVFLSDGDFWGEDFRIGAVGGTATSTILLAEELVKAGKTVTVANEIAERRVYSGVEYVPVDSVKGIHCSVAIANNSAKLFACVKAKKCVVWQHNRTSLSRIWKRGELGQLLLKRPGLVCLSENALEETPAWIPYKSKVIIPHAVEDIFLAPKNLSFEQKKPWAFFASRPSRNLKFAVDVWCKYVFPVMPEAQFHICSPDVLSLPFDLGEVKDKGVVFHGSLSKPDLVALIDQCRVLAYPGHVNETGCQVALQSVAMGVPIVTSGIGSLINIVDDQVNGFVATEPQLYGDRLVQLLSSEEVWAAQHQQLLSHRWKSSYAGIVSRWLTL